MQHEWDDRFGIVCCKVCGIVQRADGTNKPCKGQVHMRPPEAMTMIRRGTKPIPVEAFAKEIGAQFHPEDESREFCGRLVKRLARVVGDHTWTMIHKYPDDVHAWVKQIEAADHVTLALESVLARVRAEIHAQDYDDGWATDKAGEALESVCLALTPDTRWIAEASQSVWKFATGCYAFNDVVKFSRNAWLINLYENASGRNDCKAA